ncbi:hypothetical protein Q1695_007333 [Nippostrongylus brasiliensis]|nr:hypothetical protein Q1695_007333 [Nippostrongylus brasiliensis]
MALVSTGIVCAADTCAFSYVFSFGDDVNQSVQEALRVAGLEINNTAISGFSVYETLSAGQMALLIQYTACGLIYIQAVPFCAHRIATLLKKSALSQNTLIHHRKMFFLLLVQYCDLKEDGYNYQPFVYDCFILT